MLLLVLSLCGFSGALATRLLDPLITSIAADFATSVGVVALLSSAFALPFGLSQPFLGPAGDTFGKVVVIKVAVAVLALCLLASALAPDLTVLFISRVLGGVAAGGIMPVCMALIGDSFPLAVRQVALSRYIGATLVGQLVGASVGGIIAEWIGWRGVLGCAAALAVDRAGTAISMLPRAGGAKDRPRSAPRTPWPAIGWCSATRVPLSASGSCSWRVSRSTASCPSSANFCARAMQAGLREAGFVIGGLGIGGLLYASVLPVILRFASRPTMMAVGGLVAAIGLGGVGLEVTWGSADGLHDGARLRLLPAPQFGADGGHGAGPLSESVVVLAARLQLLPRTGARSDGVRGRPAACRSHDQPFGRRGDSCRAGVLASVLLGVPRLSPRVSPHSCS